MTEATFDAEAVGRQLTDFIQHAAAAIGTATNWHAKLQTRPDELLSELKRVRTRKNLRNPLIAVLARELLEYEGIWEMAEIYKVARHQIEAEVRSAIESELQAMVNATLGVRDWYDRWPHQDETAATAHAVIAAAVGGAFQVDLPAATAARHRRIYELLRQGHWKLARVELDDVRKSAERANGANGTARY